MNYIDDDQYDYNDDMWDCSMCDRRYRTKRALEQHLNSGVHDGSRYHCQDCEREFSTLGSLTQHLNSTGHGNEYNHHDATLYFDGSARPNPGRGGYGWVLFDHNDNEIDRGYGRVSRKYADGVSNNEAEYTGLIEGMKAATQEGIQFLLIKGDSQLVIRQMLGEYQVRSSRLAPYNEKANDLEGRFQRIRYEHIPRDENQLADELADEGYDEDSDYEY